MGFCRRCGDIVSGDRCKCGGRPVEPIVAFRKSVTEEDTQDKWAKTYASSKSSMSPVRSATPTHSNSPSSLSSSMSRPFPRPINASSSSKQTDVGSKVTDYIASATSGTRPLARATTGANPEAGILPSLTDNTLSKVYGSVLQPKETLSTFSCAICSTVFPPDATIYPDPLQPNSNKFMCRPCFVENGGSKGPCGTCSRPVLTLKAEGGFIHAANKYWHKRCFKCAGCSKNIGDKPMVDLLGQPCCSECFDTCLKRDTPKKKAVLVDIPKSEPVGRNLALNKSTSSTKSPKASPIIGELEERLGMKKREVSPALDDVSQRLGFMGRDLAYSGGSPSTSPTLNRSRNRPKAGYDEGRYSPTKTTPLRRQTPGNQAPVPEAVDDVKLRLSKAMPSPSLGLTGSSSQPLAHAPSPRDRNISSQSSAMSDLDSFASPRIPPIPDLISDFSDTLTQSSLADEPSSPPRRASEDDIFNSMKQGYQTFRHEFYNPLDEPIVEETNSQMNTPTKTPTRTPNKHVQDTNRYTPTKSASVATPSPLRHSTSKLNMRPSSSADSTPTTCAKCDGKLFAAGSGGSFVTVPSDTGGSPHRYHVDCFTCYICDGVFEKGANGQASFVKHGGRPCHTECAPKERVVVHKSPSSPALRARAQTVSAKPAPSPTHPLSKPVISSRFEQAAVAGSPGEGPFPRFGGPRNACPGCKKAVSPMERGVIPGPQGTRWHSSCLVCGGKKSRPVSWYGGREEKGKPGCGKKLDSAAKSDGEGGVWCRECILLLGIQSSPAPSPTKTTLSPTYTTSGRMVPQFTGTTTIARQFTGVGGPGGESFLTSQLTGSSGLNPTRSISPTKQVGIRPRPKSVIGMRNHSKSIDEGRGMFLVRQMTGSQGGWSDS
ncbi:hypothetical protein FA13DRAFT_1725224 [Coprinellus micaceus]|uniref:LIM zinc-binding domain-containing protein n=1 Tax=Coprinellus micaceus TaxID=71717 RepID=A0A4Y7TYK1_COPMI|nr:hypothetical protein FA13DRAFT_1725224 [Coprinellus micaceus]